MPDMDIELKKKFWLLGPKNIQNSLLLGYLQQNLDLKCEIIDTQTPHDLSRILVDDIVCIDALGLKYENCCQFLEQLPHKNRTIFVNLEDECDHEKLLKWPCVRGFFYKGVSQNHISKGMASILTGELWFSRKLLSHFMSNNRKTPVKIPPAVYSLTKREKQILKLSASGAKNSEIADSLNVSTHTVKTHLYNLFKKIDVGNRIQAINWAKDHLPEQDLAN
ncbi:MAG: LuxR family transcriptional regulator of csgAB operon [Bermanella sp.]|jgi:LuxR family transcriptional regulator of csgAB operon